MEGAPSRQESSVVSVEDWRELRENGERLANEVWERIMSEHQDPGDIQRAVAEQVKAWCDDGGDDTRNRWRHAIRILTNKCWEATGDRFGQVPSVRVSQQLSA